ncbi:hypothetical protein [Alkalicoccus saliphilus]|uniref:Uncharacterized protein n=1 Tax=Alkalicoccus saliphilus TaxID=200989 RepID=A0A2T4U6S7_9BACI|nr:hypothetical protein [Alkalicoccus saliphilus]PTL39104.1 hypothetical protein C6Y45_07960 [Alkalicoccus saliphilus]
MTNQKLNMQESLKILEESRVLNPDLTMKSVIEAAKKMEELDGFKGNIDEVGWSALIYTNFILASGITDAEDVINQKRSR